MSAIIHAGLAALPASWDRLAARCSFVGKRRFLASVDDSPTFRVEVADAHGLCAAAPAWFSDGSGHAYLEPASALAALGVGAGRHVVVGSPWGFSGEILASDDAPPCAMGELVDALREHARARGADGVYGLYLDDRSIDLLQPLCEQAAFVEASAVIDVPASFDAYLQRLPRHRRQRVKAELRAFTAAGLRTTVETDEATIYELVPILAASEQRHGHAISEEVLRAALLRQRAMFGDALRIFAVRDAANRLVAGAVAFIDDTSVAMRVCGVDREKAGDAFEYFHVCYYAPIQWAAEHGRTRVELGMAALEAKLLRGARLEARWAAPLGEHTPAGWSAAVLDHNATKIAELGVLHDRFGASIMDRAALRRRAGLC